MEIDPQYSSLIANAGTGLNKWQGVNGIQKLSPLALVPKTTLDAVAKEVGGTSNNYADVQFGSTYYRTAKWVWFTQTAKGEISLSNGTLSFANSPASAENIEKVETALSSGKAIGNATISVKVGL